MTPDCLRLDDYLDGRLSESESETFEAHTSTCVDCDAALDDALCRTDLAGLRDVTCPPAVVTAALRTARRAPDRAAVGSAHRSRLGWAALALAAAVAVAVGVTRLAAPEAPTVAENAPATLAEDPALEPVVPEPSPLVEAAPEATPPPPPAGVQDTPPAVAPTPAPTPPPAPREITAAPDAAVAQLAETPDDAPEPVPTAEDIAGAQRDLALAFSLIAHAQSQAGDALRSRAGPVSATLDQALPF